MKQIPLAFYMNHSIVDFIVCWPTLPIKGGALQKDNFKEMLKSTMGQYGKHLDLPISFFNTLSEIEIDLLLMNLEYRFDEIIDQTLILIPKKHQILYRQEETNNLLLLKGIGINKLLIESIDTNKEEKLIINYSKLHASFVRV